MFEDCPAFAVWFGLVQMICFRAWTIVNLCKFRLYILWQYNVLKNLVGFCSYSVPFGSNQSPCFGHNSKTWNHYFFLYWFLSSTSQFHLFNIMNTIWRLFDTFALDEITMLLIWSLQPHWLHYLADTVRPQSTSINIPYPGGYLRGVVWKGSRS